MSVNSKTRLLYLLKYLYEQTDEDHQVTTADIERHFSELGAVVDRKTVSADISALQDFGFDIVSHRSTQNRYFFGGRLFELPELKLLIDAVEASKFITAKKSEELAEKLMMLAGQYRAEELNRHLYIADRVKPLNEKIYYTVDGIHTAITHVDITAAGLKTKSTVLLEQIRTIDKVRLMEYVDKLDNDTMDKIDCAIIASFGIQYREALL